MTGFPEGDPARCGVSFLDMSTGVSSALATVSALFRRERTGRGGKVEASLLQTALGLMSHQVSNLFQHGVVPGRIGTAHPSVVPYQSFRASDGEIFIAAANQNLWERMCRALSREDLVTDPRFVDNPSRVKHREPLLALLSEIFAKVTTAELLAPLHAAGVPCAPVNDLGQVIADGQAEAIGAIARLDDSEEGELRLVNLPFFLDGQRGEVRQRAPRLGEHTRELLAQMGYPEAKIAALLDSGAVQGE